jgi:hypothetical protein
MGEARRRMREAVIEAKVGVRTMREALERTETKAAQERQQLADAERRGRMAEEIGDHETATVARKFATRHSERLAVLERKLAVQRDELALAERELEGMLVQLRQVESGASASTASFGTAAQLEEELLKAEQDQAAREADIDAQLDRLKKRMGR